MSIRLDYFFNYEKGLTTLAGEVKGIFGVSFNPQEDIRMDWTARLLGMDLFLGIHECENDLGIPFEKYRYCLGIKTFWPDADLRPLQVMTMASLPYLMFKHLQLTGMLVYELQHLIAQYEISITENGEPRLIDSMSRTFANDYAHWQMVAARIAPIRK